VTVDGKQFAVGSQRFHFRGVTYGTFQPRDDGARFPGHDQIKRDFAAMHDAGFTVVRTYTAPPDEMIELAADWNLRILVGAFYPDWRYSLGLSARQRREIARDARRTVRTLSRRLAGVEAVLGLCLGNEVPADVVRWIGTKAVSTAIGDLVEVVRAEDDGQLVTYANYPTAEYLPLDELDFLTFNVFLERPGDFRRYLTRLQHLAGDRPLVLGELGLDSGPTRTGERRQAEALEWQLETALDRGVAGSCVFTWTDDWWVGDAAVEGWHFGLTHADRSPKPALTVARHWNRRVVADLRPEWPTLSVVICAYNSEATIDECLRHTCALDYPDLEVVVVDDGSIDSTPGIVGRHPRARLVSMEHAGLSAARNVGWRAASGDVVAFLDSDAYPPQEWPYYLVLGLDGEGAAGVGGPNIPPPSDPAGAQQVARAPGGPIHVLTTDDRAEHVPGCNMAFRRTVLDEVGGFDPVFTAAGDDLDLCWRLLDGGREIGFHPAAMVWHHRRSGFRAYLRQQYGYGRAEAIVEARHPDRFNRSGSARWRGRIYDNSSEVGGRRIYRGLYGTAPYQSVYRGASHGLDLAHHLGLPLVAAGVLSAPLALLSPVLGVPAAAALLVLVALGLADVAIARPPRNQRRGRLRFRLAVAGLRISQPLVRSWGRARQRRASCSRPDAVPRLPGPVRVLRGGVLVLPEGGGRADLVANVVLLLRAARLAVRPASGWDDHDARVVGSTLLAADLVTSSHPSGWVQLRFRRRLRPLPMVLALLAIAPAVWWGSVPAALVSATVLLDLAWGHWRVGRYARGVLVDGVGVDPMVVGPPDAGPTEPARRAWT
jgi:glycosyltransferase involved in cell wall biosynthesis